MQRRARAQVDQLAAMLMAAVLAGVAMPGAAAKTLPVLHLGFCGSMHDITWPAIVALARRSFEGTDPILPLGGTSKFTIKWHLMYANDTEQEIEVGFRQMLGNSLRGVDHPPVHALIGCTYSQASEKVAALGAILHVVQIAYISSSIALSNKRQYPYFMRTRTSVVAIGKAFVTVFAHFRWKHVGMLVEGYSAAQGSYEVANSAARPLHVQIEPFIFVYYPDPQDLHDHVWSAQMQVAATSGLKVFGLMFSSRMVPPVLEMASNLGLNNRSVFIAWEFLSVYRDGALSAASRASWHGMLGIGNAQSGQGPVAARMDAAWRSMDVDLLSTLGVPHWWTRWIRTDAPEVFTRTPFFMYHANEFDAIMAVVIAFQQLLDKGVAATSARGQVLLRELYNISFEGASGLVSFTPVVDGHGGDIASSTCVLYQAQGGQPVEIGHISESMTMSGPVVFPDGGGDPRNYDRAVPLVCPPNHVPSVADGKESCRHCAAVVLDSCFSMGLLINMFAVIPAALLCVILVSVYVARMHKQDLLWKVEISELTFGDPPEILGRGSFGFVVKATYRGTSVAVKRVIPPDVRTSSRHGRYVDLLGAGDRLALLSTRTWSEGMAKLSRSGASVGKQRHDVKLAIEEGRGSASSSSSTGGSTDADAVPRGCAGRWLPVATLCRLRRSLRQSRLLHDFKQEMRLLSKLRHPCVVAVMGAVTSGCEPMLVMELMEYGSLYDLLHNSTFVLEAEVVLPLLGNIAQGLRFLHEAKPVILHGDLKAANVLVDATLCAKVSDFGLSQKRRVGAVGTPLWMAPEVLRGAFITPASDAYSFGIMLNEVCSREDPYHGQDPAEVLAAVADPRQERRPDIPESCAAEIAVLMRDCWEASAALRPSFEEIERRLKSVCPVQAQERRTRTDGVLGEIFPEHVAKALCEGRKVEPESKDVVTIYFSDIVGYNDYLAVLEPTRISIMLDRLYAKLDKLSKSLGVFKVETIGDAYMAVANLVEDQADHAKRIALFAKCAIRAANETLVDEADPGKGYVSIRVGFHSGPVVANVVGTRNPRYCLFGDTVNTASRMESNSSQNRIHCSSQAAQHLQQAPDIVLVPRGIINIKGKGEMETYWVE